MANDHIADDRKKVRLIDANALKKAKKKMCFRCWARHYLNCHGLREFGGGVEGCRRAKECYERECGNGNL